MKRAIITTMLALAALAGCDVCEAAAQVHAQRCEDGDEVSCEWMLEHIEPTTGICIG